MMKARRSIKMKARRSIKMLRAAVVLGATGALILIACVVQPGPGPGPGPGGGPQFVINNPQDGSTVSGAFFFSVQALDPSKVRSVTFTANGETQDVDFDGENKFRVFVVSGDFPENEIELTATVTGNNSKSSSRTVTVTNEPNPPSDGIVGADGLILGSQEQNGGTSLLIIPPGVAEGANVTFATRTQAEILTETGVDYDALGVTFLGAQEITTDVPLDGPMGIASGAFGPMVQPGQAVVNYAIVPDTNNDLVDELVVINTATVAPNGDVISDPVPMVQAGDAQVTTGNGTTLQTQQTGFSGPPGALLEIEVAGFNPASLLGNQAVFTYQIDGIDLDAEIAGTILADLSTSSQEVFRVLVPPLPSGPTTLVLRSLDSGFESDPIDFIVQTPPPLSGTPVEVIDRFLNETLLLLDEISLSDPDGDTLVQMAIGSTLALQEQIAELPELDDPVVQQVLTEMAILIDGNSVIDSSGLTPVQIPQLPKRLCDRLNNQADFWAAFGTVLGAPALALALAEPTPLGEIALGKMALGAGTNAVLAKLLVLFLCDDPTKDDCPPPSPAVGPLSFNLSGGFSRPTTTPSITPEQSLRPTITGMGSAVPDVNVCGVAPAAPDEGSSFRTNQLIDTQPGRITVRVLINGVPSPFTGITDAGSYFFIPIIPGNTPVTIVATDQLTGATQMQAGFTPATGESAFLFFDFLSSPPPVPGIVRWDGGGDGTLWSDPLNWDSDTLPGPDDEVIIDVPGDVTVTHSAAAGTSTINSLESRENLVLSGGTIEIAAQSRVEEDFTISGGTLTGNGNLDVAKRLVFTSGTMDGLGLTTIESDAVMEVSGPVDKRLTRSLDNAGTILWLEGNIAAGGGSVFTNLAGALFDIQTNAGVGGNAYPGGFSFTSNGSIVKSAGDGLTFFVGSTIVIDGPVDLQTGVFNSGFNTSTYSGNFTGSPGTEFQFGAGSHTFDSNATVAGARFSSQGGGSILFEGSFEMSELTSIEIHTNFTVNATIISLGDTLSLAGSDIGPVLTLDTGSPHSVPDLVMNGGVILGTDDLTVTESYTWTNGSWGGSGRTVLEQGVVTEISTFFIKRFNDRSFDNGGTVTWIDDGALVMTGGAVFDNLATGVFEVQNDATFNNAPATFNNAGTLRKTVATGISSWPICFVDAGGVVDIQTGDIDFSLCP